MPDLERLRFGAELYETYHNHKEQMAYSIFALEGAFFIGLFMLGNWPPGVESLSRELISAIFILTWVLFHAALRFQLRNRRLAAILVSSFLDAFMHGRKIHPDEATRMPPPPGRLCSLLDSFLLPCRKATHLAPYADAIRQGASDSGRDDTLELFNHFLGHHLRQAHVSWKAYAYPMEWITTLGSIFLLGVALLRVWSTV